DEESEYSIQRAGLIPRETFRSYQRCSHGDASSACASAERKRKPATSGTISSRTSSSGTATSLLVTLSMRRNELVTGSENALARASIATPCTRWSAPIAAFQRRRPPSL